MLNRIRLTWTAGSMLVMALSLSACMGVSGPAVAPRVDAADSVDQRLVTANTEFGLSLFHKVRASDTEANIFLSPPSASLALSLAYNGAHGQTQQDIGRALALGDMTPLEANQANKALQTILANPGKQVQVEIANSVWFKQGMKVNRAFEQVAREAYSAEVRPVEFGKAGAAKEINQWVAHATKDRIKSIIDRTNADDRMYLINAIYFYGPWTKPFNEQETRPRSFTRADGTTKEHPMMHQAGRYRYLEKDEFQAVALPYGDGRLSLYLFVPKSDAGLERFYGGLTAESWQTWMSQFANKDGSIAIPKLKLEYQKELREALTGLGMGIAFTGQADFSGLFDGSQEQLAISRVLQKTFLEMNEKGTEAAAVTAVGVVATSMPAPTERFQLVADRPYFLAIRDDQTGAILFVGSIMDPQ